MLTSYIWRTCPHYEERDAGGHYGPERRCRYRCEFGHGEWQAQVWLSDVEGEVAQLVAAADGDNEGGFVEYYHEVYAQDILKAVVSTVRKYEGDENG